LPQYIKSARMQNSEAKINAIIYNTLK
jgi:hypothetical protein